MRLNGSGYRKRMALLTAMGVFAAFLTACGQAAEPKEEPKKQTETAVPEDAEPETSDSGEKPAEVENNGGTLIRVGDMNYYMSGKQLYSDGAYLYTTQSGDEKDSIYQYELDESGFRMIAEGRILGCAGDGSLYTERAGEDGKILEQLFVQEQRTVGSLTGDPIQAEVINGFYADEDYLVFAAGHYEGSAGMFVGDFYSYDRAEGVMKTEDLTDADTLHVADGWVYYQKYRNYESSFPELYRAKPDLTGEEQVGEGLEFLAFEPDRGAILAAKRGQEEGKEGIKSLVRVKSDGSEEEMLLDGAALDWETEPGDKLTYTEVNPVDGRIYLKVSEYGFREGESMGWRDTLIREQYFSMNRDGSGRSQWEPQEFGAPQEDYDLDEFQVGLACDPEAEGWNLAEITDVRESFERLAYTPEPGTEEDTYLLGQTGAYTLYGKGDYEWMLLEYGGSYAQIHYPYTSNYMIPLVLQEADYDGDGEPELAIWFNIKHGTGLYIDTFFMADQEDGELTVYQFLEEEFTAQLQEHIFWERTETGIQPLVDGQKAGAEMEDRGDGMEDFSYVSAGSHVRFFCEDGKVMIRAELEAWADDSVISEINGNDITAAVIYQGGGSFTLEDIESRIGQP
ncbi:MAG: hypothetical protein KH452_01355 [Clostridiales bacterium]|nr:hypothetical protein [Clostridiales bacterium]